MDRKNVEKTTLLPKRGGTAEAQRLRSLANRDALIATARIFFSKRGFNATGINDVGAHINLTRGAVYHHFKDKEELFEAVSRLIIDELIREARAAVETKIDDVWGRAVGGYTTYLKLVASHKDYQRILLIDGPAVLGWRRWRDMNAETAAPALIAALQQLMHLGIVAKQPAEPLAGLIQAALHDAALTIAHSVDPEIAGAETTKAFVFLLDGIRHKPTSSLRKSRSNSK